MKQTFIYIGTEPGVVPVPDPRTSRELLRLTSAVLESAWVVQSGRWSWTERIQEEET